MSVVPSFENIEVYGGEWENVKRGIYKNRRYVAKIHILFDENSTPDISALREASILTKVNHPNVISLVDICFEKNTMIFVLPVMFDLGCIIKNLSPEDAQKFSYQLLCGVNYLHSLGIIHRDIKPDNLLVRDANLIICDFGLSDSFLFETDRNSGTPLYCAPEILVFGPRKTFGNVEVKKYDSWSCGCTIYEMFCGVPFIDETHIQKKRDIPRYILDRLTTKNYQMKIPRDCEEWLQIIGALLVWSPVERALVGDVLKMSHYDYVRDVSLEVRDVERIREMCTAARSENALRDVKKIIFALYSSVSIYGPRVFFLASYLADCCSVAIDRGEIMLAKACFETAKHFSRYVPPLTRNASPYLEEKIKEILILASTKLWTVLPYDFFPLFAKNYSQRIFVMALELLFFLETSRVPYLCTPCEIASLCFFLSCKYYHHDFVYFHLLPECIFKMFKMISDVRWDRLFFPLTYDTLDMVRRIRRAYTPVK
jgi:serine/threonine protein kinase